MTRFLGIALVAVLVGCATQPSVRNQSTNIPIAIESKSLDIQGDPEGWKSLPGEFRRTYQKAKEALVERLNPLIVVRFSDVLLMKDGVIVAEGKGIPSEYFVLRRVAHLPLTTYTKVRPYIGGYIDEVGHSELKRFASHIQNAMLELQHTDDVPLRNDNQLVMSETLLFLETLNTGTSLTEQMFDEYRRIVMPPTMRLADRAGVAQVDALHTLMSDWKTSELSESEWKRAIVIVIGFRQARRDYAATQYFTELFPSDSRTLFPGETDRVFYMEELSIDRNDFQFELERQSIATQILDAEASTVLFGNFERMSIDVMADGARQRVQEIFYED